jgi:hypothetical protein
MIISIKNKQLHSNRSETAGSTPKKNSIIRHSPFLSTANRLSGFCLRSDSEYGKQAPNRSEKGHLPLTRVKPIDNRKYRFDFEVGYFVKSPCRECENHSRRFPSCLRRCDTLNKVQNMISHIISTSNHQ